MSTAGDRVKNALRRVMPAARASGGFLWRYAIPILAVAWFVAVLNLAHWVWGLSPQAFPATDEAINCFSAKLVHETGRPVVNLRFEDPEDLAHMRLWVTVGDRAVPAYPPVTFYLYGLLNHLGKVGQLAILALPASAVAALFAGIALLLPPNRFWLALPAPLIGYPGFYWLLRPWMNISLMTTCLCWALLFWALWRRRDSTRWLAAALLSAGAAASIRPDYAAHILTAFALVSLAAAPARWRAILAWTVGAGVCAVVVNMILNRLISGDSFKPVYEAVLNREEGTPTAGKLQILRRLWFTMGVPTFSEVVHFFRRYWLDLGPTLRWLFFAQLALIPLLIGVGWRARLLYLLAFVVILVAGASHVHAGLFGADARVANIGHSIPRYWTPLYLLAALPPLLFFGRSRFRAVVALGALATLPFVWFAIPELQSLEGVRDIVQTRTATVARLARLIPEDAMVYSVRSDGMLWSRWQQIGVIGEVEPTSRSIERAVRAGVPIYLYERNARLVRRLESGLRQRGLAVTTINRGVGVYRVDAVERRRRRRR